jgi:hypothetical protein
MAEEIIGIKTRLEIPTTLDWSAKYDFIIPDENCFPFKPSLDKALRGESTTDVELIIANPEQK